MRSAARIGWAVLVVAASVASAGCGSETTDGGNPTTTGALALTSTGFQDGQPLPQAYTCAAASPASPPLAWAGAPSTTRSFALVVTDPDVPTSADFSPTAPRTTMAHWEVYDMPATTSALPEATGAANPLPPGAQSAAGWFPACPPSGDIVHHYHFHLYALDVVLGQPPSAYASGYEALLAAFAGHIVAEDEIVGTYQTP